MTARYLPLWLLAAAAPAAAQFTLQVVDPAGPRPAPAVFDLGSTYAGAPLSARFRLLNTGAATATVSTIKAAGVGFTLAAPALPAAVDPQTALEFTIAFSSPDLGSYSAVLSAANQTILLTATVAPSLTWRVDGADVGATLDFGATQTGATVRRTFTVVNSTPGILIVPAITVAGAGFALEGTPPSGIALQTQQSATFTVAFTPATPGAAAALLTLGDRVTVLTGMGIAPPLPKPTLSVDLPSAASAQQGSLILAFPSPAPIGASGTATLDFRGSYDPSVAFAAGGRTAAFAIAAGDTRVSLPFQTGTTAGTIVFTVALGDATGSVSIQIPAAPPAIAQISASRVSGGAQVRLTGWDNTHAVSQLVFTFYDAAGNAVAPGALRVDATQDFARFFAATDSGGAFTLRADFPVTGDTAQLSSVEVSLTGLGGAVKSARTPLQ